MHLRRLSLVTSILTGLLLTSLPLRAQFTWNGNGGAGNNIANGANWVGGNAPSPGSNLTFPDAVSNFTVLLTANFTAGALTFTGASPVNYAFAGSASPVFTVNSNITLAANYVVTFNNTLGVNLATGEHVVDVGNFGVLTLNGVVSGPGHLTKIGTGTLTLKGANTFNYFEAVPSFNNSTAIREGTLRLTGGSLNQPGGDIFVGTTIGDNGNIQIETGGSLTGRYLGLGQGASAAGSANVDGAVSGAAVSLTYGLGIANGTNSSGILSIVNGGSVNVTGTNSSIAENSGSTGYAHIYNAGSTWTDASIVKIGASGTGNMDIVSGGQVTFAGASIGNGVTGSGTVLVDGATSAWTNTGELWIGNAGNGSLEIRNGASVTDTLGKIGIGTNSISTVDVKDTGTLWSNSTYLYVGLQGQGTLNIINGAHVMSPNTSVGNNTGGTGQVVVSGSGSLLTNTSTLYVGSQGNGSLEVTNNAMVTDQVGSIGNNPGGSGTVYVHAGGVWTNSTNLIVGDATSGSLAIATAGVVNAGTVNVGALTGVNGTIMLDDNSSLLSTTGNLIVGGSGTGGLIVRSGADVITNGQAIIANNTGSGGSAIIRNTGSTWTVGNDIFVGNAGTGALSVDGGAVVTSSSGAGTIKLGHTGGNGTINIGYVAAVAGVGGILNVAAVTTESGSGSLVLGTTATSASPYFLTKDGTAGGTPVIINGATFVDVRNGYNVLPGTNTYTGATTLSGGSSLVVTQLADGGSASGIGASSSTAANLTLNNGTLKYTGVAVSTDRLFTIGGGGATLNGSGTGAVQFSNTGNLAFSTGNIATTLTLDGTTSYNSLRPILGDNGTGVVSLNVNGTGVWFINGANTYTGPTTVTGAALATGSLAFGNGAFTNGGLPSGLGASSSAAANLILNGGALIVEGPTASSDRLFTIGVGGATLTDLGSVYTTGDITFSNPGAIALTGTNTARTLTLAGTSGHLMTLNPSLGNNGTGATAVVKNESGIWQLGGTNSYTGGTVISAGTLVAAANGALGTGLVQVVGGTLKVNSGITVSNPLDYSAGGTLGGSGIIGTPFTAGAMVHLAPGNSPGTLSFSSGLTLASGGTLDFEVQSAAGPAGTGYDLLSISGAPLDITATSGSRFTLKVISLNIAGSAGAVSDFSSASSYSWTFAMSAAGITSFAANKFTIDTSLFANGLGGGTFSVAQSGNNLLLNFTPVPEPSTYALMAAGLALAGLGYRRKSRRA